MNGLVVNKKYFYKGVLLFCFMIVSDLIKWDNDTYLPFYGFGLLLFALLYTVEIIKDGLVFSVFTPMIIFLYSYGIFNLRFVKTDEVMPEVMSIVIDFCVFIWMVISAATVKKNKHNLMGSLNFILPSSKRFKQIIYPLFFLAFFCTILEWYKAGGIPILRRDSETFRFTVSYSSFTHFFSIMNKIIAMLVWAYFVLKGKKYIKKEPFLFSVGCISELLMIGTAMRGEMILAPVATFLIYSYTHKISKKLYFLFGLLAVSFVGFVPIIRMYLSYGTSYLLSLKSISTYPDFYLLTPIYQTFANNFHILAKDVNIIPSKMPFGFGQYGILPSIPFLNLGKDFYSLQNQAFGVSFYGGLTGSYLQYAYADFGYIGCVVATFFYVLLCSISYQRMLHKRDLSSTIWCIYTIYSALWLFYASTFDIVYIFYSLIIYYPLKIKISN